MRAVARLHGAEDIDRRDVGAGKGAIVQDLFDARSNRGDLRREIGQTAGPVADHGGKTREPAVSDEAALDHATEDVGIDIAAAKEENDAFAGELGQLTGKAGRKRSGGL